MKLLKNKRSLSLLIAPLVLVVLSSIFVTVNVMRHDQISPIDEYVYLDYAAQIFETGILPRGSETGNVAREYISCIGVADYGEFNPQACQTGDFSNDDLYPYGGKSSADIYTPLYFLVTASFAKTLQSATNIDFMTAARMSGAIWLSASSVFLFLGLRRLKVDELTSLAVSTILISSLPSWWSSTFISTDVTAIFAGSVMFYAIVLTFQKNLGIWLLALTGVFVTLLKFQNIIAVGLIALILILNATFHKRDIQEFQFVQRNKGKRLIGAVFIVFSALLAQVVWVLVRERMAIAAPVDQGVYDQLTPMALLAESTKFISGISWGASTVSELSPLIVVVATITTWLTIAGAAVNTVKPTYFGLRSSLGFSWIAVSMLAAPFLGVAVYFMSGFYFSLPARYGLSLFPIALSLTALGLGNNLVWRYLIAGFSVYALAIGMMPLMEQ